MKFRNPWIDPRILRVRPEDVQAYLARRGWQCIGPATDPSLLRYERVEADTDAPTLFVPAQMADKVPCVEVMIELVAELARHENRWAVDVLQDIRLIRIVIQRRTQIFDRLLGNERRRRRIRQILGNIQNPESFRGDCVKNRSGGRTSKTRRAVGSIQRDYYYNSWICQRRKANKRPVVSVMRITVGGHVEDLGRSGLAARRVARQLGPGCGAALHHDAFHHLAHRNGGFGPDHPDRRLRLQ